MPENIRLETDLKNPEDAGQDIGKLHDQGICYICRKKRKGYHVEFLRVVPGTTITMGGWRFFHICKICNFKDTWQVLLIGPILMGLSSYFWFGRNLTDPDHKLLVGLLFLAGLITLVISFLDLPSNAKAAAFKQYKKNPADPPLKIGYALTNSDRKVTDIFPDKYDLEELNKDLNST